MSYETIVIIATMIMAFLTNGRIGHVLGKRWGCATDGNDFPFFEAFCAVLGAAAFWAVSRAAFDYGGMTGGLIALFGSVPFSGFVWVFIVGGNKAIERVLNGLMKKVD